MIEWIHKNKRSLSVFLILSAVALSMSFFGVDMGSSRSRAPAISVNKHQYSFEDFQKERRNRQEALMAQYRQILGDKFSQFAGQLGDVPAQQVIDSMISKTLLDEEAERLNLHVGPEEVKRVIIKDVFNGNFNSAAYSAYLARVGMNSRAFENKLKGDLLTQNYSDLLKNVSTPSKKEIRQVVIREETKYGVDYLEIDPAGLVEQIKIENDKVLEDYFSNRQTDYETPARISYSYAVMDPANFRSLVSITPEDIEFYYVDNQNQFMNPEQAKVSHIQINIPSKATQEDKDKLKVRAEEAHAKATAGEDFAALVSQYSDDISTVSKKGELGWITKGKMDKRFDAQVFPLKTSGIAPLITTDYGFQIVKVEEYKESTPKNLEEVKAQIENEIRTREAPSFTSAKANEIYDSWIKDQKPIEEITKPLNLTVASTQTPRENGQDPDVSLPGLTKAILATPEQKFQIVELSDKTVLVQVNEYQEPRIPAFSEVKQKVTEDYKKEESKKLASQIAGEISKDDGSGEDKGLKKYAEKHKLKIQSQKDLTRKAPGSGVFTNKDVQDAIFSVLSISEKIEKSFEYQGKKYVFQVTSITPPSEEQIKAATDKYLEETAQESSRILLEANLNRLKAKADIDIDQSLLAGEPQMDL